MADWTAVKDRAMLSMESCKNVPIHFVVPYMFYTHNKVSITDCECI